MGPSTVSSAHATRSTPTESSQAGSASVPGQSNVRARLHALFPRHEGPVGTAGGRPSLAERRAATFSAAGPSARRVTEKPSVASLSNEPAAIKIKIVTWNMHESLPQGDLRPLLGAVPPHVPLEVKNGALPPLPLEDEHPYHVVIIAGQECPTHSGIPMGLGATFKDRHKDKERLPERDTSRRDNHRERQRKTRSTRGEPSAFVPGTMSGWSAILEDWLQNGVGSMSGAQPALSEPSIATPSDSVGTPMDITTSAPAAMESTSGNLRDIPPVGLIGGPYLGWNIPEEGGTVTLSAEQARIRAGTKGPYILLCKERLMGIYIAVFVHRDCRSLVKGYSTETVTAGLMGGRVGNKGGAGVSLDLAGTRMLFINAHLAAHEGKVALRLANLLKIKTELEVDAFLPPNDPRLVTEDVTDRFDYTFVFGDLNFRLDVSRLHADWLISRKEYAQALEFDQLHRLLKEGALDFNEEPPRFPPTYKYDIRRRSMRDALRRRPTNKRRSTTDTVDHLDEADEAAVATDREEADHDDHEHGRRDFESSSFVSTASAWTGSTAWTTDVEDEDEGNEEEDGVVAASLAAAAQAAHKLLTLPAAQKAKTRLIGFLQGRPSSPTAPSRPTSITPETLTVPTPESLGPNGPSPTKSPMIRSTSTRLHVLRAASEEDDLPTSYDSSSKQRVPSWCDRILWKSTIEPEPDSASDPNVGSIARRGSFRRGYFSSAWPNALRTKSFSGRDRRDSVSTTTAESQPDSPGGESPSSSHPSSSPTASVLPRNTSLDGGDSDNGEGNRQNPPASKPPLLKSITYEPSGPATQWYHKRRKSSLAQSDSRPSSPAVLPLGSSPPRLPPVFVDDTALMPAPTIADEPRSAASTGANSSKWWHHIPGLASRVSTHDQSSTPLRSEHRRGDVVVLSYKTLDDAEMRLLDGRSDHRPVLGAYAVYV